MKHLLDPPFSTYAQSSEKSSFYPPVHTHICANYEVRNVGFSENFEYALNGWCYFVTFNFEIHTTLFKYLNKVLTLFTSTVDYIVTYPNETEVLSKPIARRCSVKKLSLIISQDS